MTARTGTWDREFRPAGVRALTRWTTSPQLAAAMALAVGREASADWKPETLPWLFGKAADTDRIREALVQVVRREAARAGIEARGFVVAAAVGDAMTRVQMRSRRCISAAVRAKEVGLRKAAFLRLRNAAEAALLVAVRDGLERYLEAFG